MTNTLYPHQETGAQWLADRKSAGLFDEQGLGKTISAIVAADRVQARRVLVICPTVVAYNWQREFSRWSPSRRVQVLRKGTDKLDRDADVVVCSYALLIAPDMFAQLTRARWNATILDEAHYLKNHKAKRTLAVYPITSEVSRATIAHCSDRVWLLTGTPLPNNPSELWTHLRGLAPERILPSEGSRRPLSFWQFRSRYCKLRPSPFNPQGEIVGAQNVDELKGRMRGFSMRRLKADHLDLPPVRWGTVSLPGDLPAALLALEAELKLVGDDLSTLSKEEKFATWRRLCGEAKAPAAVELLHDELEGSTHKLVVFAHHTNVVDVLFEGLRPFNPVRITGDTPAAKRTDCVTAFQNNPGVRVAICNIVAGGVGITLTAAHDVVFVESSFVPGENAQAADRCHRIGQGNPVLVRVLSLAGSVDERVAEVVALKSSMIREVLQ